jgi:flagellar basal body rod protein FlgG
MFDAITATQLAMDFDQLKLQSISQNISNMNTPGFKRQLVENAGFDSYLQANVNEVAQQLNQGQIKTQGTFAQTHNLKDLAISGEGYFQVQGAEGIFYTRRGDFQVNAQGELTTATGETVLGKGGVIKVDDHNFTIDPQGILYIDHHKVDQLNIVTFNESGALQYAGKGLYECDASPTPASAHTQVLQGFIEQSNVKSIDEMMEMVKTSRHFEANQRVMRTADSLLSMAINQLGDGNV